MSKGDDEITQRIFIRETQPRLSAAALAEHPHIDDAYAVDMLRCTEVLDAQTYNKLTEDGARRYRFGTVMAKHANGTVLINLLDDGPFTIPRRALMVRAEPATYLEDAVQELLSATASAPDAPKQR